MSHIANALAKMKGKTVEAPTEDSLAAIPDIRPGATASPFATGHGASVPPFAAKSALAPPAPAKVRPRWLIPTIALTGLVIMGAGAWLFLAPNPPPPVPPVIKAKVPAPVSEPKRVGVPVPVAPPPPVAVAPAAPVVAPAPAIPEALPAIADAPAVAPPEPSPALAEKVRTLPLGAAMTAPNPRVLIGGRLFVPGDKIAEGLVLQEVLPGLLVFHDKNGAVYTRRF